MHFNLHTHTSYCDGSDSPESYIEKAVSEGFTTLGFSSHAPVPFRNNFAIPDEQKLLEYCHHISRLKEVNKGKIEIFLSLEIDYIPGITRDFDELKKKYSLDYCIGSVHLIKGPGNNGSWFIDGPNPNKFDQGLKSIFGGDIKKAIKAYYHQINDMIIHQKPDITGHLDKVKMHNKGRYFSEDDKWYRDLVMETLRIAARHDTIIEVNTRGLYKKRSDTFYPGLWILSEIRNLGIPVTISTDAHKPDELTMFFEEAKEALLKTGFTEIYNFSDDGWVGIPLEQ